MLDATDARALAEFYRKLLGCDYRPGDEAPPEGDDDPNGRDFLMLVDRAGAIRLAFQQVSSLPRATWPEGAIPQQLHLDMTVASREELQEQHRRVLALGAEVLRDESDDPVEPIYVYADPEGHPFCIFVAAVP